MAFMRPYSYHKKLLELFWIFTLHEQRYAGRLDGNDSRISTDALKFLWSIQYFQCHSNKGWTVNRRL